MSTGAGERANDATTADALAEWPRTRGQSGSRLLVSRAALVRALAAYGEETVSGQVVALDEPRFARVAVVGYQYVLTGMPLVKAACLAAIEVIEGAPRALARERRRRDEEEPPAPSSLTEIRAWFAAYGGGAKLNQDEIFKELSDRLGLHLPDYRYLKTKRQFRLPFADGIGFIGLTRGHSVVELRFGLRLNAVEDEWARLHGASVRPNAMLQPATIAKWTANMGPRSPHWRYPTRPAWPISGTDGLTRAADEMMAFLTDVVEPYLLAHRDPLVIRDTLLHRPGQADGARLAGTVVFAIDSLMRRRDWLEADYRLFLTRHPPDTPARAKLDDSYTRSLVAW